MAILHVKSEFYLLSHLQNVTVCLEHIHATAFFQQYLGVMNIQNLEAVGTIYKILYRFTENIRYGFFLDSILK